MKIVCWANRANVYEHNGGVMGRRILWFWMLLAGAAAAARAELPPPADSAGAPVRVEPLGRFGRVATYRHAGDGERAGTVVERFRLAVGLPASSAAKLPADGLRPEEAATAVWTVLRATTVSGKSFSVWVLGPAVLPEQIEAAKQGILRYIVQRDNAEPLEFRNPLSGRAVLPAVGGWRELFPRAELTAVELDGPPVQFPARVRLLGHAYRLESVEESGGAIEPPHAQVLALRPDLIIGTASSHRQKDETRRYDDSDYEYVPLNQADYREMLRAGINCFRVDAEQIDWIEGAAAFYWGPGGDKVDYPVCLYQSNYLGPHLFLDEPAVCTRDYVVRPKLRDDPALRRSLTPEKMFAEFQEYFLQAKYRGSPAHLLEGLRARPDVDLGEMSFLQQNLYSWETMISSSLYQLGEGGSSPPAAMVFEPPGHVGTMRTLPEMNMTYGCQIPVDDPKHFIGIIYGFLRGAARLTGKEWGTSIYGSVDRADAFWFLTHGYDLGATHFFFWDNAKLACVPYSEILALVRNLRARAENRPHRDLERLKRAAEVAILLPPGYNLGHVDMGKGSLWGLGELNLERRNAYAVRYRDVMGSFFTEIERCIRLGLAYDLFWDLPEADCSEYREVIRIREDARVEVEQGGRKTLLDGPRTPIRPGGVAPELKVEVVSAEGRPPVQITARAHVREGSAPIYYTLGPNPQGVFDNVLVAWELYGPEEEDYLFLRTAARNARIAGDGADRTVEITFEIPRPGRYRLRAATADMSGRTAVVWENIAAVRP